MSTQSPTRSSHDQRVRSDGLDLLYRQWISALLLSIIVCLVWFWLMWGEVDRTGLLAWGGGILFAIVVRASLFVRYRMIKPQGEQLLLWERPFCLTLLIGTSLWGVGTPLLLADASLLDQLITFLFLIGISGMAISAYGILPRFTILMVAILVLPMALLWLLHGGQLRTVLAACTVFYVLSIARGVSQHASAVYESYRLRHQLDDAYRVSDYHANTDPLTGIQNRRAFFAACDALLARQTNDAAPSCMLLLDLDDFKRINDTYGHAAGDVALKYAVGLLRASCRSSDPCGRLGGDEFAIFLHQTSLTHARTLAEKLRKAMFNNPVQLDGVEVPISISIGVSAHASDIEALMAGADSAMYQAKRMGKNQLAVQSINDADTAIRAPRP